MECLQYQYAFPSVLYSLSCVWSVVSEEYLHVRKRRVESPPQQAYRETCPLMQLQSPLISRKTQQHAKLNRPDIHKLPQHAQNQLVNHHKKPIHSTQSTDTSQTPQPVIQPTLDVSNPLQIQSEATQEQEAASSPEPDKSQYQQQTLYSLDTKLEDPLVACSEL